jgi:hypothetical protein
MSAISKTIFHFPSFKVTVVTDERNLDSSHGVNVLHDKTCCRCVIIIIKINYSVICVCMLFVVPYCPSDKQKNMKI